jgi:hypothetical protein
MTDVAAAAALAVARVAEALAVVVVREAAVSVVSEAAVVAAARAEVPVVMTGADRVPKVVVPIAVEIAAVVEIAVAAAEIVGVAEIATSATDPAKTCRQPVLLPRLNLPSPLSRGSRNTSRRRCALSRWRILRR